MNCQNCGNEIEENQKFCTNCGANIKVNETKNKIFSFFSNKRNIAIISVFIILALGLTGFCFYLNIGSKGNYKSIVPIEQSKIQGTSTTELLNIAIQQENDLAEIIQKLSQKNASKLFETFYINLSKLVENMSVDDLDIKTITTNNEYTYKLNPDTKLINYEVNDWTGIWINNEYLNEKYSKYLNEEWQEYLKLASNDTLNEINKGYNIDSSKLIDEIIAWQEFEAKYPNFALSQKVKDTIKFETERIIYHEYTFSEADGSITKEYKKGYEEFLKRVNSKNTEYQVVKNCYEVLKNNGFKPNSEFFKILNDFSPNDWYKEQAEGMQWQDKIDKLEAKETWEKVGEHLYFDKNSFKFKEYSTSSYRFEKNKNAAYQIIETGAYCDIENQDGVKKLEFPVYTFYDENNKFLSKDDIHEYWAKNYPDGHLGVTHPEDERNGDIYFDTLCKYTEN